MISLEVVNLNSADEFNYNASIVIDLPVDFNNGIESKNFIKKLRGIGLNVLNEDEIYIKSIVQNDFSYDINYDSCLGFVNFKNLNTVCNFLEDPESFCESTDWFPHIPVRDKDAIEVTINHYGVDFPDIINEIPWEDIYYYETSSDVIDFHLSVILDSYSHTDDLVAAHPDLFNGEYVLDDWKYWRDYEKLDDGSYLEFPT